MAKILDKPLDNVSVPGEGVVKKNELRAILKNISVQVPDAQSNSNLEVFEVLELKTDAETKQQEVIGRYVYSQHGDIEVNNYKPCNSNIIQYPMVGELWLGLSYKDENYYLARLSDTDISVNYQKLGESEKVISPGVDNTDVKTPKESILSRLFGTIKKDINPTAKAFEEGSTLIQGRFDNYINLGSDEESRGIININNADIATIDIGIKEQVTFSGIGREIFPEVKEAATITMDADRIELNARDTGIEIVSEDSILIDSNDGDILLEAADRIRLRPRNSVIDFETNGGQKRDFANPDGDTMMPKYVKERAGDLRPLVEIFKLELQALPYLILPPVLPGGIPNPSFMIGMKIKYDAIKFYIEMIKRFITLEWLPKHDFEMVNIQEVVKELGLGDLPGLDALGGFDGVLSDIAGAKAKLEVMKGVADGIAQSSQQVGGQLNSIVESGEVEPSDFITTLDEFESSPDNPPIDTTDVRDIISDGANSKELQRYFLNGGSPKLQELVRNAAQGQQDVAQLEQVINLAEISQLAKQE